MSLTVQGAPSSDPAAEPRSPGWSGAAPLRFLCRGRGRPAGLALLLALAGWIALEPWPDSPLQRVGFDAYQSISPRIPRSAPVAIVAVDESSLARYGQWPWPRCLLARLLDGILAQHPAAVGLDMLMPEPDRYSPEQWADDRPELSQTLREALTNVTPNDEILAISISRGPVVLGIGGLHEAGIADSGPLVPVRLVGDEAELHLRTYPGTTRNLPRLERAARGHGLLNAALDGDGLIRRLPLAARLGARTAPSLGLEMLRLAIGAQWFELHGEAEGVKVVSVGTLRIPTDQSAMLPVFYSGHSAARFVSAADVLAGSVAAGRFTDRLVLLGVTGIGLVDHFTTPVAANMPGVEIHAQLLENIFDGTLLSRPSWAPRVEALALLLGGALLLWLAPSLRPRWFVLAPLAVLLLYAASGWLAYRHSLLLIDPVTPSIALMPVFLLILVAVMSHADQERRRLAVELALERERSLKTAGELEAAKRIQMGMLPDASAALLDDRRFELSAEMVPAREVGGDLYDYFLLDPQRLFFTIGDVAGKGVPASLFMAISKTLWKKTALRLADQVEHITTAANAEIASENPEMMFVTGVAGILHLDSGELEFTIAGHDAPFVIGPQRQPGRLEERGGPPLCVFDTFEFPAGRYGMALGETLILFTDGVTEARNPAGELYGSARLRRVLERTDPATSPQAIRQRVVADVAAFTAGAPAADDLTLLLLRWNGPQA